MIWQALPSREGLFSRTNGPGIQKYVGIANVLNRIPLAPQWRGACIARQLLEAQPAHRGLRHHRAPRHGVQIPARNQALRARADQGLPQRKARHQTLREIRQADRRPGPRSRTSTCAAPAPAAATVSGASPCRACTRRPPYWASTPSRKCSDRQTGPSLANDTHLPFALKRSDGPSRRVSGPRPQRGVRPVLRDAAAGLLRTGGSLPVTGPAPTSISTRFQSTNWPKRPKLG